MFGIGKTGWIEKPEPEMGPLDALVKPIAIVDYYSIDKIMEEYKELFLDQIQNSSYILLSKLKI